MLVEHTMNQLQQPTMYRYTPDANWLNCSYHHSSHSSVHLSTHSHSSVHPASHSHSSVHSSTHPHSSIHLSTHSHSSLHPFTHSPVYSSERWLQRWRICSAFKEWNILWWDGCVLCESQEQNISEKLKWPLGMEVVTDVVRYCRLRWFEHLKRKDGHDLVSTCRSFEVTGPKNRGSRKKTWMNMPNTTCCHALLEPQKRIGGTKWRAKLHGRIAKHMLNIEKWTFNRWWWWSGSVT